MLSGSLLLQPGGGVQHGLEGGGLPLATVALDWWRGTLGSSRDVLWPQFHCLGDNGLGACTHNKCFGACLAMKHYIVFAFGSW